eukprot:GHVS01097433.1.p1 GENE.GHVS01097433.1~~GHVS01097433.1.p1  ORF type:complete len:230 (+),score=39.17 GHVS01097433.1:86-691(+)
MLAFISIAQYMNSKYQHQRMIRVIKNTAQFQRAVTEELIKEHGAKLKKLPDDQQALSRVAAEALVFSRVQVNDGEPVPGAICWRDMLIVRACCLPYTLAILAKDAVIWHWRFTIMGDDFGDGEKTYLTKKKAVISDAKWTALSDAEKKALLERKLWIRENCEEYTKEREEEEREKLVNTTRYRQWKRWKKKNPDTSYMMDD